MSRLRAMCEWLLDYSERIHVPRYLLILSVAIALRLVWIWVLFPKPTPSVHYHPMLRQDAK